MADTDVPMVLWHLHRRTAPGDLVDASVVAIADAQRSADVIDGGGFESVEGGLLRRCRTLADTVAPGLRLLMVGLNPSLYAADAGVGFARPGNRFWPAALASGIVTADRDPLDALDRHRVGMTDLVKRATVAADELTAADYIAGVERLERLCRWLSPAAVCVAGLTGWRAAVGRNAVGGWQPDDLGGAPVYLMPNPSGLNARVSVDQLAADLTRAAIGPSPGLTPLPTAAPRRTPRRGTPSVDRRREPPPDRS